MLAASLEAGDLHFQVTEVSALGQDPFMRVHFEVPRGVFVSTYREGATGDEPGIIAEEPRSTRAHKSLVITRSANEGFVMRPTVSALAAARDLIENGIIISGWFERGAGDMSLRICASTSWLILRDELAPPRASVSLPASAEDTKTRVFLTAFAVAAEEMLPAEMMNKLKARAWKIARA